MKNAIFYLGIRLGLIQMRVAEEELEDAIDQEARNQVGQNHGNQNLSKLYM